MSGGHFDYDDSRLDYLAEQLEQDVKYEAKKGTDLFNAVRFRSRSKSQHIS